MKSKFPNQRSAIVARLNEEYERVLYVQASTLRAFHPVSKLPTVLIGEGLIGFRYPSAQLDEDNADDEEQDDDEDDEDEEKDNDDDTPDYN